MKMTLQEFLNEARALVNPCPHCGCRGEHMKTIELLVKAIELLVQALKGQDSFMGFGK